MYSFLMIKDLDIEFLDFLSLPTEYQGRRNYFLHYENISGIFMVGRLPLAFCSMMFSSSVWYPSLYLDRSKESKRRHLFS